MAKNFGMARPALAAIRVRGKQVTVEPREIREIWCELLGGGGALDRAGSKAGDGG